MSRWRSTALQSSDCSKPGGVYFLRVEANSPGYDLELRIRRPAPYTDVRAAVRMGMYDHIAQVERVAAEPSAW